MEWDAPRFEAFVNDTVRMSRGELTGYGYPNVIFPYHPQCERECIERVRTMPARLSQHGLTARCVSLGVYMADAVRRYATDGSFSTPATRALLQRDLGDLKEGVLPEICARIAADEDLARADVIVLARVGTLYPFASLSGLLEAAWNAKLRNTLAVAYPGTAEGIALNFLGAHDQGGAYRGHVSMAPST